MNEKVRRRHRHSWAQNNIRKRFGEFCSCCCSPLLPQLAWSTLATWGPLLAQPCTRAFSHLNCFRVRTSLRKSPSSTSPSHSPPLIRRSISNLKLGFARRRWRHRQFSSIRLGEHTYTWLGFITSHQLREIGWKICVLFTYCKQVKALFSSNFIQMMGSNKP